MPSLRIKLLSGLPAAERRQRVGEYELINLFRIAADSFASEQASRLVAMDGATRNTERALEELHALERRERQGEITRQVLELIAARFATE
jgi:F-type H+-transporting ATPase subunit gamma